MAQLPPCINLPFGDCAMYFDRGVDVCKKRIIKENYAQHLKWSLSTLFKILCQSPRLVNTCDLGIICVVNIANVWLIQNPPSSTRGSLVACFPSHVFHPKWSWSCSPKKDRKTWWSKYWALQDLGMPMIHIMDRGKKSKYLWNHQQPQVEIT